MTASTVSTEPVREMRTLICKRDLEMGRACLSSLLEACREPIRLIVHEDGTLSKADFDVLREALPGAVLVRRNEAAARLEEQLRDRPGCRAYRARHPLSNKLLDIPLLAFEAEDARELHYIDSDILFFRHCTGLFAPGETPVFLQEDDQGYSGPLLSLLGCSRRAVPSGCNTGLFRLPRVRYDLDFIEWFLGRRELWSAFPTLTEQTCLALLMESRGSQVVSPRQISCSKDSVRVTDETIAVHFMSFVKKEFSVHVAPAAARRGAAGAVAIELLPATRLTPTRVAGRKIKRSLASLAARSTRRTQS